MVRLVGGQTHHVEGEGNVLLSYNGSIRRISNVLYVTRVTKNLLSIRGITDKGCLVIFGPNDIDSMPMILLTLLLRVHVTLQMACTN